MEVFSVVEDSDLPISLGRGDTPTGIIFKPRIFYNHLSGIGFMDLLRGDRNREKCG
jgi:hypothetical protein